MPMYRLDGRLMAAFRFAYNELVGPLPDGHGLYVACRGIACANPHHRVVLPLGQGKTKARPHAARARKKREAREHWARMAKQLGLPPSR